MRKYVISIMSPFLLSVATAPALAQDKYKDFGFIGAGLAIGKSVFSHQGTKAGVEPYLFYNSEHGFIDGSLFTYNPIPFIGLSGNLRFAEVSEDFNDIPSGINNRDSNGELGITLGTVGARLTYLLDVTNEQNGYEIQLHFGRAFDTPITDFVLSPYVEIDYRDKKLSRHLYSVSAQESSASGLAEFNADETWVYKGGVIALYDFSENWLAISAVALEHHDIDSPLVQNDLGWEFSLGAIYKF
ncbi:MipA/OmpV family protein [Grimontia marina]|uniref:MltA-interacting protein MipA n=1 Tax=Grimontia marina TaxID=646534 RepID=A0A128F1S4_9GAMM|nr:MipA/OmpV family protein [Grimontia marina]CZF80729.1 MltA-interacting protein MipA [Grimontia marina]